jgi:hypothetical protein
MPGFGRLFDLEQYKLAFDLACVFPIAGFLIWWTLTCGEGSTPKTSSISQKSP